MTTTKVMTAEDLWRLGDADEVRRDLIRGELIEMPPASGEHGEMSAEIARLLGNHVVAHQLGKVYGAETGFVLARDPDTILAPDAAFVRQDRLPPLEQRRRFMPVAPDLAVEIVSPSERRGEIAAKVKAYQEAGVPLLWFADPRTRTITVHMAGQPPTVLHEDDLLNGGDVLPGFQVRVGNIFPS